MQLNASVTEFENLVNGTDTILEKLNISKNIISNFWQMLDRANRVFITGTGTSYPNALFLEHKLQERLNRVVIFLPTAKMIRKSRSLNSRDLVIIISHGLNRADSLIIYNTCVEICDVVVITGNEKFEEQKSNRLSIVIPPYKEKIFCRPVSPISTLLAINELFTNPINPNSIARYEKHKQLTSWMDPFKQLIILYTADMSYSAELWGIILREGAGMNVSIKDIENYSHGYYGVDTANLANRQFLILTSDSSMDIKDLDRANGLYGIAGFNSYVLESKTGGDTFMANLSLFYEGPKLVLDIIKKTNFNMNEPNGMEENRKYHEYDRYENYI